MDILQHRRATGRFLVAALVTVALGGCATSREQPSPVNANAGAAPEAAQPAAREVKLATRVVPSPEASSKKNAAAILAQIHQANLREIAIGEMAERKATTSEVRAYADQLVKDQTNADQTVIAAAQKMGTHLHGVAVGPKASRPENAHAKLVDKKLSSASGSNFDRLFLQQSSSDHKRLIRTLRQKREDASNDEVEALIDQMIPILEQHRELAQILIKKEQAQSARS